jgi:AhpD family alkylhydroperoxidase
VKYISPVPGAQAPAVVADIYRQVRLEFGVLGAPIVAHSPAPRLLGAVWAAARETILAGTVRREVKEAVAVAVSLSNDCPYCVDAHTVMLRATAAHDAAGNVRFGRADRIADPEVGCIAAWASRTVPRPVQPPGDRPFPPEQVAEIIGTVAWMHYINRIVTVFVGRRLIFAPRFGGLRALCERAGGRFLSGVAGRRLAPGESLRFIEGLDGGRTPAWAAGSPRVAEVFSALDRSVEAASEESVPAAVAGWLDGEVERWDGSRPPVSRSWLSVPLGRLGTEERPVARVALLSAVAPWQLGTEDVSEFRQFRPTDSGLIGAVALGAWTAARRISAWL